MRDYRYNLIRYVPDAARMEPRNVGVILQGDGKIDVRFYQHAGRRGDIDAEQLRQWRLFFTAEIQTAQVSLFQPDRNSEDFLRYLESLSTGPVHLSKPLALLADPATPFERILDSLYQQLVVPPEAPATPDEKRPTGTFRRLADERKFLDRGMKRHSHVIVENHRLWMAYRQINNGEDVALDKVEVARELGSTSNEIERLPLIAAKLGAFLRSKRNGKERHYYLLIDQLSERFTGQSQEDFDLMRKDLDEQVKAISDGGGRVLQSPAEVADLVQLLDGKLPPLASKPTRP